jgi:hypothetical protein
MKTLVGAIALVIAAPVAAQAVPSADPGAGHAQHQQQGQGGHSEHKMDCCKDCKPGCCDRMKREHGAKAGPAKADPAQGHQGHDSH